ncbi:hypothetical protein DINM_001865 [Dirofilaria immitis]|nr:hypothetical protein [Dirofilaria immitis]
MGTITAMIVICCLIISAALTVVIILVTIPTDIIRHELYYPEIWDNRENIYQDAPFHLNETVTYNLRNDIWQNSPVISVIDILFTTTIPTVDTTKTTTSTAVTITTIIANAIEISMPTLKNDKLYYQSSIIHDTTIPIKIRKSNDNESSGKSTTLHQHIEQLPLIDNDFINSKHENEQAIQMELLREITFPKDVKMVGLAMQQKLLYVATSDGRITVIDPETNKQVNMININGKINRVTVTQNGDIIVLNGSNLILYRNTEKYREIDLPVVGKSLSAFKNEDGEIKKIIGINNGTFSLGITIDDQARIIAIVRDGKLRYNLSAISTEEISAIWSEVLYENGRLHVVDYLTSKLKLFAIRSVAMRMMRNIHNLSTDQRSR